MEASRPPHLPPDFQRMAELYARVKSLVLLAEESDPDLRNDIAVVKEMRDAFDHVMRYVTEAFMESPNGENYKELQISKAFGHLFRAAYDTLDGMVISLKEQIHDALQGRSNEAIAHICPAYFKDYAGQIASLEERVRQARQNKGSGGLSTESLGDAGAGLDGTQMEDHFQNLREYQKSVEVLNKIRCDITKLVPEMVKYDREQRWKSVLIPLLIALGSALVGAGITWFFGR